MNRYSKDDGSAEAEAADEATRQQSLNAQALAALQIAVEGPLSYEQRGALSRALDLARLGAAVEAAPAAIILGTPKEDDIDHNCDYMGCGSTGPHILFRKGNI